MTVRSLKKSSAELDEDRAHSMADEGGVAGAQFEGDELQKARAKRRQTSQSALASLGWPFVATAVFAVGLFVTGAMVAHRREATSSR